MNSPRLLLAFTLWAALAGLPASAQPPTLRRQGTATQLIVDGKPFLARSGELGNNTASSLENMLPLWDRLSAANLNCVLAAVSWAQLEPSPGQFRFELLDGLLAQARQHNLKLVLLWFGSWKNGLSSYAPYWVKQDFRKYPRIRLGNGSTLELLSTFGDATRDADARAFSALMRHLKEVDSAHHTVLMVQVENEVGVLRDSRDRSETANRAFASAVPQPLLDYLTRHRDALAPELLKLWNAHGARTSGTWEQVFGPGKPADLELPIQTTTPPLSKEEHETAWREWKWASDEIFMAWHYGRYVNAVIEQGKAAYDIPMFVNAWLQQPNHAWPGTYPSGGPLPQVNDIWRAAAPACDLLAPDAYLAGFDEVLERYSRNGNPIFIPETNTTASNVLPAFANFGAIGFSPFFIERALAPDSPIPAAYRLVASIEPLLAAHQGRPSLTAIRMKQDDAPRVLSLGNYKLQIRFLGRGRIPIAPEPASPTTQPAAPAQPVEGSAVFIASGPDEFYLAGLGGSFRISFTPTTPGPALAGLGDVQEGRFVNGKWSVLRQLGGDDTAQGEILSLRPNQVLRVSLYRYE